MGCSSVVIQVNSLSLSLTLSLGQVSSIVMVNCKNAQGTSSHMRMTHRVFGTLAPERHAQ